MKSDIFHTEDDLILAPTAEEEITKLVSETVFTHKSLPLKLYQIGPKFRQEQRPKGGLLRLREFLMKDLYTFDKTIEEARKTFHSLVACYMKIFGRLDLPVVACKAATGSMGGHESIEFQLPTAAGEDIIQSCLACGSVKNTEIPDVCCDAPEIKHDKALELGHAFLLGDLYSRAFGGGFTNERREKRPFQMGCYGIGISRLMAALAEMHHDHEGLAWPAQVAPFTGSIIFDDPSYEAEIPRFMSLFSSVDGVLIDDRTGMSIGKKLRDHLLVGIPTIMVLGSKWKESGVIEYHQRREQHCLFMGIDELAIQLASRGPPISLTGV